LQPSKEKIFLNENNYFYHCGYYIKKYKLVRETSKLKKAIHLKSRKFYKKTTLFAGNKQKAPSVCSLSLGSTVLRIFGKLLHYCVSFSKISMNSGTPQRRSL